MPNVSLAHSSHLREVWRAGRRSLTQKTHTTHKHKHKSQVLLTHPPNLPHISSTLAGPVSSTTDVKVTALVGRCAALRPLIPR